MPSRVGFATAEEFRARLPRHPGAVTIVTSHRGGGLAMGFTSASVVPVSAEPPRLPSRSRHPPRRGRLSATPTASR